MSISNDVIESAQKAHSALEKELNLKSLRCSFLYWSHKAYITNKSVDASINKLIMLVGSIFMTMGGGGSYIFSKSYPRAVELVFCLVTSAVVLFYFYKKKRLISSCKHVRLNERPIWAYLKNMAGYLILDNSYKACGR